MNKKTLLFAIAATCSIAFSAAAQLIAYESFTDLDSGAKIGGSGTDSFGWTDDWSGSATESLHYQIVDPTPNLSYQIIGGSLVQGGNRSLQLTTNPEPVTPNLFARRTFPPINTTFYISFLMRIPSSGTGSDSIDVHLMSGDSTVVRYAIRPNNPAPPSGLLWSFTGATGQSGSGEWIPGDNARTHLVVIEARRSVNSFFIESFVNPDDNLSRPFRRFWTFRTV
ncbi:MAG: hypothetical protein GVY07_13805 [Bacteroidetes bacterium]|jgi:hypothetical protein|nr:hypothetical protein [Bacteroidota bacterium]